MVTRGHTSGKILNKLREVEVLVANGNSVRLAVPGRTFTVRALTGDREMNR